MLFLFGGVHVDIKNLPLTDLVPYDKNAKKHDNRQINNVAESIKQYGFVQPIVIDRDGVIVIGHCRALAAKKLGMEEVPCVCVDDLTPEQVNALRLVDNKSNESDWDFDLLADELPGLDLDGFDFDWGLPEIAEEVVEDEAPEVDEDAEPIAKLGDIWQLGRHRLMCGDSTKIDDVEKLMGGNKADMVFTDPPYGNGESGKYGRGQLGVRTILNDENLNCFNDFVSIMPCDKMIYFLQWRTLAESLQKVTDKGLKINTVGVWDKKNAGLNGAGGISEQWEAVVFCGDIKYSKFGGNVFRVSREKHKRSESVHPHMKPQELLKQIFDFISDSKNILDAFGGSGSTLIACEQLDRTCYMMELDPKYCDVIIKRYEKFTGEKAMLLNDDR